MYGNQFNNLLRLAHEQRQLDKNWRGYAGTQNTQNAYNALAGQWGGPFAVQREYSPQPNWQEEIVKSRNLFGGQNHQPQDMSQAEQIAMMQLARNAGYR